MKPIRNALTSSSTLYSRIALASVLTLGSIGQALALPEDPTVVSGNITFNSSDPRHLIIQQLTQRGIIDWRSFNISADEWVQFQQPGATSVTLNRVFGGNPTEILGRLSANGNVMIVNPNGILFGAGSQVDVAGLVATTADITNANFNAGRYNFDIPGRANASVINHGNITVADKGLVALVAPGVSNTGVITARMGTVQLGAAETFTVDMYGDGLYSFGLGKKTSVKALDENGNELDAAVSNSGTISAQGGSVYLTANAAGEVLNNAVNNTGVIEATSLRNEGGVIVLDGGEGNVQVAGTLNASGKNAGEKGGKIQVTGKNIKLASATVDASGAAGGGTVQIGGEAVGKGSSKTVVVDENSTINVSATNNGDGGTAIIWSDDHTDFKGTILGNGGINGGNGGFAEVSSHNMLTYNGLADLRATNGEMGTLLLDPMNIVVDNAMAAAISATLAASNVILDTSGPGPDVGNITVNGNIISGGTGNLTLLADNDIILNSVISLAFGDLILDATRDIIMNAATVSVDDFSAVAGGEVSLFGSIIASANNIIINNTGRFFSDTSNVLLANNSVQLNQSTAGSIQNAIDAINPVAASSLLHLHDGTWNENVNIDLANLTLEGNGWLNTIIRAFGAPAAVVDINAANVTLRNLGVDGLNNATNGVNADFANNVTISGVDVFRTTSHGFEINNGNNFSLTGNRSRFTGGSGIYVFNGQDFDLTSNQMFFNGNHAIEIAFSVDFDLFDNRMSNTVGDGINIDNSRFFTVDQSNIRFTGGNGIAISNSQDFSVTNGLIQDTGDHAIDLTDSKRFTVTDNEIKAVTGNGINMLRTSSATVSGNEIGQASGHGMAIDNSFLFNIIRNQFNGIGLNGVWVNFSSYFNIDGNSLNNVDAHGIHITDRSNHFGVDGNNLTRIADNGINIADAFTFDLTDNTMRFVDGKGIAVARSRDFDLVDNTVRDTGDHAFDIIISRLFDMTGNLVERSAGRGVNISESNNFDVADNTIKQTTGDGIGVRQSFLFDLIHNTISSVAANAIDITFSSYFNVLSNQMFFAGHGINIWDRSNNFLLDDNRMSYLTGHGININNAFTFDANNSNIRYTGGRGINIADSRDFGLDDNAIRNSGTDSIGVSDSEDFGITHNFSRDSGADAIIVENSENFDVDDNTLLFSGANGITVINGVDF
ncbi:MAG: right-handed parallel beta-helix repeat-containing protein, partial [Alphaproteobacteria bacterium]